MQVIAYEFCSFQWIFFVQRRRSERESEAKGHFLCHEVRSDLEGILQAEQIVKGSVDERIGEKRTKRRKRMMMYKTEKGVNEDERATQD